MLVTCEQMALAEQNAFASGVDQAALMEHAGGAVAEVIRQQHPRPGTALLYVGKGNNGGDALVAGRHLRLHGWQILWRLATDSDEELKPLPLEHLSRLRAACPGGELSAPPSADEPRHNGLPLVIIDGLLGIGTGGSPRGVIAQRIREILSLRQRAAVVAVDLPSGFDADTGATGDPSVIADTTVTFGFLKQGFVTNDQARRLGRLVVVDLPGVQPPARGDDRLRPTTAADVAAWLPRRDGGWHKGRAGRVAVIAGSTGSTGAGVLAATAALRAGAGLVTLWTRPEVWSVTASLAPPELMVRPLQQPGQWHESQPDALVIGPGIGLDEWARRVMTDAWCEAGVPLVLDADGLTLLARDSSLWRETPAPRVLTPHPGELRRLLDRPGAGPADDGSTLESRSPAHGWRLELAYRLRETECGQGWTWVLKGGHTLVVDGGEPLRLCATGHAGMATGGAGDTLAGIIGGLLAQGLAPGRAAAAAAWLNGRAAEIATTSGGRSQESLTAGDLIHHLGMAFESARDGCW